MRPVYGRLPMRRALLALALTAALGASALAGCSRSSGASAACGKATHEEAQFPANHVLPGQPEPTYLTDPPTSGPHAPLADVQPRYDTPLPKPTQVGVLEAGKVLVQYRPDVPAAGIDELQKLAGGPIVVAPNPDLDHPVIATAWLYTSRCDAVDVGALRAFARSHADHGPGGHTGAG
jgi:hypothetical protein